MNEKTFFSDKQVTVTESRFVTDGKTYVMKNISSVQVGEIIPNRRSPILLLIAGSILTLIGFSESIQIAIFGLAIVVVAGFWLNGLRTIYTVRITSNSGEGDAFSSKDKSRIEDIVEAINSSIISGGN